MNVQVPPEVRRERLRGTIGRIIANAVEDRAWAGSGADCEVLREYGALCREFGDLGSWADAAWLLAVLLERQGDLRGAEQEITELRKDQDLARQHVAELGPRARVTGKYHLLPGRLAKLRYRLGDGPGSVFDAVEWAKGRALSDAAGEDEAPDFEQLLAGLVREGLHYLTFLLDEDESFAVLATKGGSAEVALVPVGRSHIQDFATPEKISPQGRTGKSENPFAPSGDWTVQMAALAGLVDAAFGQGRMSEGDTRLVSPHGALHFFPVHSLRLASARGRAIGEAMAVVRVHGAAGVIRGLQAGEPGRPREWVLVRAPTQDELLDPAYMAGFERCRALLERRLGKGTKLLDGGEATEEAILQTLGPNQVLHLSCHGHMLSTGPGDARSFLLLAYDNELAGRKPWTGRAPNGALTAAAVLKKARELGGWESRPLRGTHVTLQACVSGHASANPQGDAIGLEWAFLMAGAASTIGTHWYVDRDDAMAFVESFYDAWLGGRGRASAWAAAGATLRRRGGAAWEAFSLTGEWR